MSINDYTTDSIVKQQRQLKIDQMKFQKKSHETINKQSTMISELNKTNARLREELTKADTTTFKAAEQEKLSKMQEEIDELEMKMEYERMRRGDIQNKLAMSRVDFVKSRANNGGVNGTLDNARAIEKQISVLENQLDLALKKFNETLTNNNKLRVEIDHLREERQLFNNIYKKLEGELHNKKKAMADKIEMANMDYEERDQIKQELEARKSAAEEDKKLCQESFTQLDKVLEQLRVTAQEQKRQQMQMVSLKPITTGGGSNNNSMNQNTSGSSNKGEYLAIGNASSSSSKRKVNESGSTRPGVGDVIDEDSDLQEVVDDLKVVTGYQDLRLLLENFLKSEELNFSTYNYINNLNTEQEGMEKEIIALKEELAAGRGDVERRKILKELENELAAVEMQQEKLSNETARHRQTLTQVRTLTNSLFTQVGCDSDKALQVYGTTEASDHHLEGFLGLLEQRINELLFTHQKRMDLVIREDLIGAEVEAGSDKKDVESRMMLSTDNTRFIGVGPAVQSSALTASKIVKQIQLPSTNAGHEGGGSDPIEADIIAGKEEILTVEEMRQRVDQRMKRRAEREERVSKASKKKSKR